MIFVRSCVILVISSFISVFTACSGDSNVNSNSGNRAVRSNENANVPHTNAEELGMLVKIPYETEDIVWKEYPSKRRILAILRFSPADANKLTAEAGGPTEPATIATESWFPDELIAQSEMSGDNALKGTSYPATAFAQEPYSIGKLTRVEGTDYFILEMLGK